jgi:hypothetical protein
MTREETLAELARQADEQAALAERERKFRLLKDRNEIISYEIGEAELAIRWFNFKLMTIPYSEITEIEVEWGFVDRSRQINMSNGVGSRKMCRVTKSRGWYRYVLITPREPKDLLNALYRFRSLAAPVAEMSETNAPLPPFLRPHDH